MQLTCWLIHAFDNATTMTDNSDPKGTNRKCNAHESKGSRGKAVKTITMECNAIMNTVKEMKRIVDLDLMSQPTVIDNSEVLKVASKVLNPKDFDDIQDFQYGPFGLPDLLN